MKVVLFTTNLLMGAVLSRFAISKLAGWDISVKAFIEMAQPLGIDPTFFRIFTGIVILTVVVAYLCTAIFTLFKTKIESVTKIPYRQFAQYSNLLGLLTMAGALLSEFYLRVNPKWMLVYIAAGIILFSLLNLLLLLRNSEKQNL